MVESSTRRESIVPPSEAGAAASSSPDGLIAVVWCRQVDNEAESPGYSTIPEDFPGRRETLDSIRIVGNLTINVADTHDYWDPDPTHPLSYYPNLFLYPAYSGRYTCVGRMFLSTEDRPRLGMKTLVLDTAQLLEGGSFGPQILRWHASMGGPRPEHARLAPDPDPNLIPTVGEGFLFHRGSTDPVLAVVGSDQWEATTQAVLELVRLLPTSLVALGAVLIFPYFLPQPKTNLHELTEAIPLAIGVMRVPKGEAQGDRHEKRIASWDSAPVTLRDLTKGVPAPKGRETTPMVLQYVRDHQEDKLAQIAQRVDLVEAPRLIEHLSDPDRQAGKDRRKQMWRIGTAMESAALLLQRPRGRQVPMSTETARRANEYLRVRADDIPAELRADRSVAPAAAASMPLTGQLPPWLQRGGEPAAPARTDRVEVIPVPIADDPSLRPSEPAPAERAVAPAPVPVESERRPVTGPIPSPDLASLRKEIERDLVRYVDERTSAFRDQLASSGAFPSDGRIPPAVDERLKAFATEVDRQIQRALADVDTRYTQRLQAALNSTTTTQATQAESLRTSIERRLADTVERENAIVLKIQEEIGHRLAALDERVTTFATSIEREVDRQMHGVYEPRIQEVSDALKAAVKTSGDLLGAQLRTDVARSIEDLKVQSARTEQELRTTLSAQFDVEIRALADHETALREQVESRVREIVAQRLAESDQKRTKELRETEARTALLLDGRSKDLQEKVGTAIKGLHEQLTAQQEEQAALLQAQLTSERETRLSEVGAGQSQAIADLQVRLQSYFEQKTRENQELEREKYLELLARLKTEVDQSLAKTIDSGRFESVLRDRIARGLETERLETQKLVEQRLTDTELRWRTQTEHDTTRFELLESKLERYDSEALRLEGTVHAEIEELDRRTELLSERLLPLVRRAWLKIGELEKTVGSPQDTEAGLRDLRREYARELRRIEGQFLEQTGELRDRLETAIASQGRVWLTLVQQLSQLTGVSRSDETGPGRSNRTTSDLDRELAELPDSIYPPRGRSGRGPSLTADVVDPMPNDSEASEAEADATARRRTRRS
jgi:hypothetical protein